ncbi:hypothetical protein PG326_07560 [Riemerella anatipestifer]|uniref:hypothetical protein n=1 Tax=Riemerella anatipestifer TaxID=34085 RepID=UPI002A871E83|nr:hypothetical protein [Riemerella anatipestifer]MDY3358183.1 hypothetical protein [Riemerella anatipestifer]MDY3537394.1 hypothetical protein [Riemerella anatipestifer]
MKYLLRFSLLLMLYFCKSQENKSVNMKIISAEKSLWFGGVKGVRGERYKVVLSSSQKLNVDYFWFEIGGVLIPTRVKYLEKGDANRYLLEASHTYPRTEMIYPSKEISETNKENFNKYYIVYKDRRLDREIYKMEIKSFVNTSSNFYP